MVSELAFVQDICEQQRGKTCIYVVYLGPPPPVSVNLTCTMALGLQAYDWWGNGIESHTRMPGYISSLLWLSGHEAGFLLPACVSELLRLSVVAQCHDFSFVGVAAC